MPEHQRAIHDHADHARQFQVSADREPEEYAEPDGILRRRGAQQLRQLAHPRRGCRRSDDLEGLTNQSAIHSKALCSATDQGPQPD